MGQGAGYVRNDLSVDHGGLQPMNRGMGGLEEREEQAAKVEFIFDNPNLFASSTIRKELLREYERPFGGTIFDFNPALKKMDEKIGKFLDSGNGITTHKNSTYYVSDPKVISAIDRLFNAHAQNFFKHNSLVSYGSYSHPLSSKTKGKDLNKVIGTLKGKTLKVSDVFRTSGTVGLSSSKKNVASKKDPGVIYKVNVPKGYKKGTMTRGRTAVVDSKGNIASKPTIGGAFRIGSKSTMTIRDIQRTVHGEYVVTVDLN